jgi:diaminopimelate epimerase
VVAVASEAELQRIDFMSAPEVNPVPENGTNVEAVVPLPNTQLADGTIAGHLAMRVHERGVGETQSCGTGACAAALAVRLWTSQAAVSGTVVPDVWLVDIPGGQVRVTVNGADVELAGPAVLIASGTVNTDAL